MKGGVQLDGALEVAMEAAREGDTDGASAARAGNGDGQADVSADYEGTARIFSMWKRSSKMAYGLFLVHLKLFFSPGYLSGI